MTRRELIKDRPADLKGECDRCHLNKPLFWWHVDDEPGEWAYCERCLKELKAFVRS